MEFRVTCFSNETEKLINEFPLSGVPLSKMQSLFGRPSEDPMYYCYPIDEEKAAFFQRFFGIEFNFDQYCYFLEQYV
ncbi:DUF7683 domain-containing protein [Endozoicomonas gorgoniicola]